MWFMAFFATTFLLSFASQIPVVISQSADNDQPQPIVKVTDVTLCDITSTDINIKTDFYLQNIDAEGYKAITGTIEIPEELNEELYLTFQISKYNNGDWNDGVISKEGQLCEVLDEYVSKEWEIIRQNLSPPLPDKCKAPKGKYKLNKYEIFTKDLKDLPSLSGRFRAKAEIYKGDETVLCAVGEFTITDP